MTDLDPKDMKTALAIVSAFLHSDEELFEKLIEENVGNVAVISHIAGMAAALIVNYSLLQEVTPEEGLQTIALRLANEG